MSEIDLCSWEGDVTGENVEQVKRALQERISTRHVVVDKHELFRADDLMELTIIHKFFEEASEAGSYCRGCEEALLYASDRRRLHGKSFRFVYKCK